MTRIKVVIFLPGIGATNLYSESDPNRKLYVNWKFLNTSADDVDFYKEIKDPNSKPVLKDLVQDSDITAAQMVDEYAPAAGAIAGSILGAGPVVGYVGGKALASKFRAFGKGIEMAPGMTKITGFFRARGWTIRSWVSRSNEWKKIVPGSTERIFSEFPYDWRKDIRQHANDLGKFIRDAVLSIIPDADIYLVGHSTGGLISRAYLATQPQELKNIKKQVLIATPNHGSPKAYRILRTGKGFAMNTGGPLGDDSFPANLPKNAQELTFGWPLVYQLLPDSQYAKYWDPQNFSTSTAGPNLTPYSPMASWKDDTSGPFPITIEDTYFYKANSSSGIDDELRKALCLTNDGLSRNALDFHDKETGRDSFLKDRTYVIYNDELSTATGLVWTLRKKYVYNQGGAVLAEKNVSSKVQFDLVGDGTVPARSVYDIDNLWHPGDDDIKSRPGYLEAMNGGFNPGKHFIINMNGSGANHSALPCNLYVLGVLSEIIDYEGLVSS